MNTSSENITLLTIAEKLKNAQSVLILSHENPDGDTLGAAVGLAISLQLLGKPVFCACCDEVPKGLEFIPEYGKLKFIKPEKREDIPAVDTVVTVDIASKSMLCDIYEWLDGKIDIKIDHHSNSEEFATLNYIDPTAASATEIIFDLSKLLGTCTKEVCTPLYAGLISDTGCFRHSNTTYKTFAVASEMAGLGVDMQGVNKSLFNNRQASEIIGTSIAMLNMKFFFEGRAVIMLITTEMMDNYGLSESDFGDVSGLGRTISGVWVSISLKQTRSDEKTFKISVRSDENFDASAFCEKFGGGGHLRAAGAKFTADSPEAALNMILTELKNIFGKSV